MRKPTVLLLTAFILISSLSAFSEEAVSLDGMSYPELLELQKQLNTALWSSNEWKEVTIPVGIYEIGVDIPSGRYSIRTYEKNPKYHYYFRIYDTYESALKGGPKDSLYSIELTYFDDVMNLTLLEGTYINISVYPVVFSPYVPSFSFH